MKLFDLKAAIKDVYGRVHWHAIGTIFAEDDGSLIKFETGIVEGVERPIAKPVGFVIDYPQCSGIIVPRPKKIVKPVESDNHPPTEESPPDDGKIDDAAAEEIKNARHKKVKT